MAEIHGTLGCLAVAGGKEVENLLELHTAGLTYTIATRLTAQNQQRGRNASLVIPKKRCV